MQWLGTASAESICKCVPVDAIHGTVSPALVTQVSTVRIPGVVYPVSGTVKRFTSMYEDVLGFTQS